MKTSLLSLLLVGQALAADPAAILQSHLPSDSQVTHVEGRDGWRFLTSELRHLLAGDPAARSANPLEAITDTHAQLAALGIRLVVVPVPAKVAVQPDKLDTRLRDPIRTETALYEKLRSAGVEVLDLSEDFSAGPVPFYCQRDSHWNGAGIGLAADRIAEKLKGLAPATTKFSTSKEKFEIQGDLGGEKEFVTLAVVTPPATVEDERQSPILVLGDSHALVFHEGGDMHAANAGLSDQLAALLGLPIDLLAVRGSGATAARVSLARRARANPEWLREKKAVVWCLAAREFTQADVWKPIPLLNPKDPQPPE